MDKIRSVRLRNEFKRLKKLERESSLFKIRAVGEHDPPESYLLSFDLKTLVKEEGRIKVWESSTLVHIYCPLEYPREAPRILIVWPRNIFHPNISFPFICLSKLTPDIFLNRICEMIADVLSYRNFTMHEGHSLNPEAARWARQNRDRFPIDRRSLVGEPSPGEPSPGRCLHIKVW